MTPEDTTILVDYLSTQYLPAAVYPAYRRLVESLSHASMERSIGEVMAELIVDEPSEDVPWGV